MKSFSAQILRRCSASLLRKTGRNWRRSLGRGKEWNLSLCIITSFSLQEKEAESVGYDLLNEYTFVSDTLDE